MLRHLKPLPVAILAFLLAVAGVSSWVYFFQTRSPQVIPSNFKWERFYFELINRSTELAKISELREVRLKEDDLEIRIWRGFGLSPLEAIILSRVDGIWQAFRIETEGYDEPTAAKIIPLEMPRSGWEKFWTHLVDKGIVTIPDASLINCKSGGIDGLSYVIELNHKNVYRTYMHNGGRCEEAKSIDEMAEFISFEFDAGDQTCTQAEWLACAQKRHGSKP